MAIFDGVEWKTESCHVFQVHHRVMDHAMEHKHNVNQNLANIDKGDETGLP